MRSDSSISSRALSIALVHLVVAIACAQDSETVLPADAKWRVRLQSPLSTSFNRKGDMVSAVVLEPEAFKGTLLEGLIRETKAGGASKIATVQFDFVTLHVSRKAVPVNAVLLEVLNSKQEAGVDETGATLESGGATKGGKLANIFSKGAGATRLTSKSSQLTLATGSEFVLQVSRGKATD